MKVYETTFILSPQADDAAFDRQINAISNLISKHNGKLIHEDRWGIRRLAYPIKKFTQGFYTRLLFEGTRDLLNEMERHFKLEEPYLRHLTVIFEGDLTRFTEPKREERPAESKPAPAPKEKTSVEAKESDDNDDSDTNGDNDNDNDNDDDNN